MIEIQQVIENKCYSVFHDTIIKAVFYWTLSSLCWWLCWWLTVLEAKKVYCKKLAWILPSYAELVKLLLIECELQQSHFFIWSEFHRFFLQNENWMGNTMLSKCCRKKLFLIGKRWNVLSPPTSLFPLVTKLFLFTYWSFTSLQQKHIMAERNVLLKNVKHPFLVGLHYSFQTTEKLYFVLDFVNGGEVCGSCVWVWVSLLILCGRDGVILYNGCSLSKS